jgi:hypothetical protein
VTIEDGKLITVIKLYMQNGLLQFGSLKLFRGSDGYEATKKHWNTRQVVEWNDDEIGSYIAMALWWRQYVKKEW